MRLIDADALKTRVAEETKIAEGLGVEMAVLAQTMRDCIYEELENSPTVEAEDVRQGMWIEKWFGYGYKDKCSECGCLFSQRTNYCPNCGAKMDIK